MIKVQDSRVEELVEKLLSGEEHLSFSSLNAFAQSPKAFIDYKFLEKEETPAIVYGSVVHCLTLEPEKFDLDFFVFRDLDICKEIGGTVPRNTNRYKAWAAEEKLKAGERTTINEELYNKAVLASEQILSNNASKWLIKECYGKEVEMDWEFKNFKFLGYKDAEAADFILDLKTCQDADPRAFQRNLILSNYFIQAAMYLYGTGVDKDFYFIAVDGNLEVSVHKLERELIMYGMERYDQLVKYFNTCIIMNAWDKSYDFYSDRRDGAYLAEKPRYI